MEHRRAIDSSRTSNGGAESGDSLRTCVAIWNVCDCQVVDCCEVVDCCGGVRTVSCGVRTVFCGVWVAIEPCFPVSMRGDSSTYDVGVVVIIATQYFFRTVKRDTELSCLVEHAEDTV